MEYAIVIAKQILVMFLIICVGIFCYKKNIITKEGNKYISEVVLKIVCPVLVFMAYQTEYSKELLHGLLWALVLSAASYVVAMLLSGLVFRKNPKYEYAIESCSATYSNCAFMGFPLISALFGDTGILYTTAYLTMFNLLVWSHGRMVMTDTLSAKGFLTALRSPAIIAVFLGMICYVTQIRLPAVPREALSFISSMNTPLAMLVAGVTIAQTNILQALKKPRVYLVAALRLLVIPVAVILLTFFWPVSEEVYVSIILATACPTATICTLFAISYDKNAPYASELFAVTTILSAVTMPMIVLFTKALL